MLDLRKHLKGPLEVVGRGSETQLEVSENLNHGAFLRTLHTIYLAYFSSLRKCSVSFSTVSKFRHCVYVDVNTSIGQWCQDVGQAWPLNERVVCLPRKHDTLKQRCFNVGRASKTMDQH